MACKSVSLMAIICRTHTGEASFPCLACGEGFASKAELNAHNRLVHGGLNPNAPNTTIVTNKTATVIQQQQQAAAQQQAANAQAAMMAAPSIKVSESNTSTNEHPSYTVVSGPNVRYGDKMVPILTSNYQSQNTSNIQQQSGQQNFQIAEGESISPALAPIRI